ncbi:MAG TPA: anhydro-N-acetylmuramic acid kinase, partial [Longimicrobium sp.]
MKIVGLMSGTSLDGVDAALVEVTGAGIDDVKAHVVHALTVPYEESRRAAIHDGILAGTAEALCGLHAELGEWLAEAVVQVCRAAHVDLSSVDAVGSHGQTVW